MLAGKNYAGDITLPAASLIVRTILSVFPVCRIFREGEAPTAKEGGDFTNMAIFCKTSGTPLQFRKAVISDFLASGSRQGYLQPQFEIDTSFFKSQVPEEQEILTQDKTYTLKKWQSKNAIGHWQLMRTVLPTKVWENW